MQTQTKSLRYKLVCSSKIDVDHLSGFQLRSGCRRLTYYSSFAVSFHLHTQLRAGARHVTHASATQVGHHNRFVVATA